MFYPSSLNIGCCEFNSSLEIERWLLDIPFIIFPFGKKPLAKVLVLQMGRAGDALEKALAGRRGGFLWMGRGEWL